MRNIFILLFLILSTTCYAQQIPDLDAIDAVATGDLYYCVDVSDSTDRAEGTGKKCTTAQLKTAIDTDTDTTCDGESCSVANTGTLDGYEASALLDDTDTTCDSASCNITNTGTLDGYEASALLDNTDTQLTEEQVEDFVGGMLGGTETGIAVTYEDATGDIDFVVTESDPNALLTAGTDNVKDTHLDFGTGANQVSAIDIPIADSNSVITATEVETALDEIKKVGDYVGSPMIVTGGAISEGTNAGTFKVGALTALVRATSSVTGTLTYITLAEQDNQAITAADTTYIVLLDYNAGTPQIVLAVSNPYEAGTDMTQIPIGKVMKDGSDTVHYVSGGYSFEDGVRKLHRRIQGLHYFTLASGSSIAYQATNQITMTAGVVFGGVNKFILSEYDSNVTDFIPVYSDGGAGFTEGAATDTIDFAHYDDGDGTLGSVGTSKYGSFWIYRHSDDGDVYIRYGEDKGSLASAEASPEPTKPTHLTDFGILIGKIVMPYNGGSFSLVQMVTDVQFTAVSASDHGNLTGLSDDDHTQYGALADNETITGVWALGSPTATTPAEDDNDTSVATTAYVQTEIAGLGGGHDEVTLAGEDYLSLSTQEITAIDINDDNINWTNLENIINIPIISPDDITNKGSMLVWFNDLRASVVTAVTARSTEDDSTAELFTVGGSATGSVNWDDLEIIEPLYMSDDNISSSGDVNWYSTRITENINWSAIELYDTVGINWQSGTPDESIFSIKVRGE